MGNKVDLFEDEILSTTDFESSSSQNHCEWLLKEAQRACDSGDSLLCDELIYQYAEQCILPLEKEGVENSVSLTDFESSSSQNHCEWLLKEAQRACDSGDSLLCDELIYQYAEQCILPLEKGGVENSEPLVIQTGSDFLCMPDYYVLEYCQMLMFDLINGASFDDSWYALKVGELIRKQSIRMFDLGYNYTEISCNRRFMRWIFRDVDRIAVWSTAFDDNVPVEESEQNLNKLWEDYGVKPPLYEHPWSDPSDISELLVSVDSNVSNSNGCSGGGCPLLFDNVESLCSGGGCQLIDNIKVCSAPECYLETSSGLVKMIDVKFDQLIEALAAGNGESIHDFNFGRVGRSWESLLPNVERRVGVDLIAPTYENLPFNLQVDSLLAYIEKPKELCFTGKPINPGCSDLLDMIDGLNFVIERPYAFTDEQISFYCCGAVNQLSQYILRSYRISNSTPRIIPDTEILNTYLNHLSLNAPEVLRDNLIKFLIDVYKSGLIESARDASSNNLLSFKIFEDIFYTIKTCDKHRGDFLVLEDQLITDIYTSFHAFFYDFIMLSNGSLGNPNSGFFDNACFLEDFKQYFYEHVLDSAWPTTLKYSYENYTGQELVLFFDLSTFNYLNYFNNCLPFTIYFLSICLVFILLFPVLSIFILNGWFFSWVSLFILREYVVLSSISGILGSAFLLVIYYWNIFSLPSSFVFNLFPILQLTSDYTLFFSLHLEGITTVMFFVIHFIGGLVNIYAISYLEKDPQLDRFLGLMYFFAFTMLLFVSAGNLIILFAGWEGVGLTSYLLINFWFSGLAPNVSGIKALLTNRIGDLFFLCGIALTLRFFGTLDLFSLNFTNLLTLDSVYWFDSLFFFGFFNHYDLICLAFLLAALVKSAQLGFHVWLPVAMEGPTPVSALLHAATMVTAGVFLVLKLRFFYYFSILSLSLLLILGAVTAFVGSFLATSQYDLKRIIAYSTMSQLGFMFVALGVLVPWVSLFHLFNHAFFKALLFLIAGCIIHSLVGEQDIRRMGGLRYKLPIEFFYFVIGSASLIGLPIFSGFYSKEAIVESLLRVWQCPFSVYGNFNLFLFSFLFYCLIGSIYYTAFYSIRVIYWVFVSDARWSRFVFHGTSSRFMLLVCDVLGVLSIFSGLYFISLFINTNILLYVFNYETFDLLEVDYVLIGIAFLQEFLFFIPITLNSLPLIFIFLGIFTFIFFSFRFLGLFINTVLNFISDFMFFDKLEENYFFSYFSILLIRFYYIFTTIGVNELFIDRIYNNVLKNFLYFKYWIIYYNLDRGWLDITTLVGLPRFLKIIVDSYRFRIQTGYIHHGLITILLALGVVLFFYI